MSTTMISISERTNDGSVYNYNVRRQRIVIHDGPMWHMGNINNEKELQQLLAFLGVKMEKTDEREDPVLGKIEFYRLDKLIKNVERGGFWSLDDLKDISKGGTLRKVKGLSNGSVVDCYIEDVGDTIYIYRPNPNAKNVYVKMDFEDEMNFRRNNWYL